MSDRILINGQKIHAHTVSSPFCPSCGNLISSKLVGANRKLVFWCDTCQQEINADKKDTTFFQEQTMIEHSPKEKTRILDESSPPPIPKIFTQSLKERRESKRCRHPNAVFQGFYQFSKGDEASRKYWFCPDCGSVFRFSGRINPKTNKRIIAEEE